MSLGNYTDVCRDGSFGPGVPRIDDCRGGFDFTVTFEESVFSVLPACILLLVLPLRLLSLRGRPCKTRRSWLRELKLAGFTALGVLQAVLLAFFAKNHEEYRPLLIASGTLQLLAVVFLGLLSQWEHRNATRPSFLISAYLALTIILDSARARTQSFINGQDTVAGLLIAIVVAKVVLLVIETRDKTAILFPEYAETSPELRASLFSRAFFIWLLPLLVKGFKGVLSSQNLPTINEMLASPQLAAKVEARWERRTVMGNHSLMFDVLFSFPKEVSIILISSTIQVGLTICQPFLIEDITKYLIDPQSQMNTGYGLLGGFVCVSLGSALVIPWCFHYHFRLMIMARGALVSMIYAKLLRTRVNGVDQSTAFTLMTTDVEKIVDVAWRLLEPWYCILQIGICTYLLYRQLGAVCCVPIVVIFVTFGLVILAGYKVPRHQDSWFQAIETRVNLTAHTLSSLQSVKLLGLSDKMETDISKRRRGELLTSQNFRVRNCLALAASFCPTVLSPLITYGAYSIMRLVSHETPFPATTALTALSIISLISTPARQLLLAIPLGLQAIGSFSRIQAFLVLDETPVVPTAASSSTVVASGATGSASGTSSLHAPPREKDGERTQGVHGNAPAAGRGLALRFGPAEGVCFRPGSITAITGPIGCGKSTVLKGLLLAAEDAQEEEAKYLSRDIAYCAQTPWIFDGTVRDNIVGQSVLDPQWYQDVVRACELETDISRMPEGDATLVGSKGSRLSGGQRQRICLARALYADKTRAIFDDVTSALDGRTLCAVAERAFGKSGILRTKGTSVVLATHAVQILQEVDRVLLMGKTGEIIDAGTYTELAERHQDILQHQTRNTARSPGSPDSEAAEDKDKDEEEEEEAEPAYLTEYQLALETRLNDLQRQKGDWRSYAYYLGAMGWANFGFFVLLACAYVVFNSIFQVWLTWWAEDSYVGAHGLGYWLGLYGAWAVLITLMVLATPLFFFTRLALNASVTLHEDLLVAAMRAPMSIISKTDIGSLVNRFSQDIRLVDWQLPFNMILTLFAFLLCLAGVGFAISAVPYIAVGIPFLFGVLYLLQSCYLRTSRQLRLLEIELKAPIVSLFLDTIQGLATIRAFGWAKAYEHKSAALLDASQKPYYLLFCVQRWLLLVLALIVAGLQILVVGLSIGMRGTVTPSLVGLAIIQVAMLTETMSDLVMQWTEMETSLGAVTRIHGFTHETPREEHLGECGGAVAEAWPARGAIVFDDVSATYGTDTEESLALDGISFSLNPGEHVGICGRTGSGKSTLVSALLRLLPCHKGRILIDGIDIASLDPSVLRSKLNLVTQEPFLFPGSMRENLSPWTGRVSDSDATRALQQVDLWDKVAALGGLDAALEDTSFSHGQRQLFCLARALLRESRILVLDEPTGHIDPATDATIQRVIREGFRERTIIMIAHRLQSLVHFDKVIVLDSGRLVEFGAPGDLLADGASSFFGALYHASEGRQVDRESGS
ncbi:putative multidrug resistance-associated protein [Podospora appendiculata]|uniref:Multidrug resistance-associated protein n=1 Tax=Podospora appendiculata TaxID=314037 RepID=A0AAE1C6W5_9PEZI|nr:putative multidrug resistance-associated protein [Podospora appendiculata]